MRAENIPDANWSKYFKKHEFPTGVLKYLNAEILLKGLFPLRERANIPLIPSKLYRAHVRHENGKSLHCTCNYVRLSTATDFHVKNHDELLKVFYECLKIDHIKGIGLYFDTNTPMIHIDSRKEDLFWLRYKEKNKQIYVYMQNDYIFFQKTLTRLLT